MIPVWIIITSAFLAILAAVEYVCRENRDAFIRRMAGIGLMIFGFYIAFNWSLSGQAEKLKVEELTLLKTRLGKIENGLVRLYVKNAIAASMLEDSISCSCLDQKEMDCVQRRAHAACPSPDIVQEAIGSLSDVPNKAAGFIDTILQVNSIDTLAKSFVKEFEDMNSILHYKYMPHFDEMRTRYNRGANPTIYDQLDVDHMKFNSMPVEYLLSAVGELVVFSCLLRRALEEEYDVDQLYREAFGEHVDILRREASGETEIQQDAVDEIQIINNNIDNNSWLEQWNCVRVHIRNEDL